MPRLAGDDRTQELSEGYRDRRVIDQLCDGHRNMPRCPTVTVLPAYHSGVLRFYEAVAAQIEGDSAPELGWLQPVVDASKPLELDLDGERVAISGFVASCPGRVGPRNGVQQNDKIRTTTDKSWPKLEALPSSSEEVAVNPMIALGELAKSEFPKVLQFATVVAVMMQAEPTREPGSSRGDAAAAAPHEHVHSWEMTYSRLIGFGTTIRPSCGCTANHGTVAGTWTVGRNSAMRPWFGTSRDSPTTFCGCCDGCAKATLTCDPSARRSAPSFGRSSKACRRGRRIAASARSVKRRG